jgi:hypothetical protein
VVADKRTLVPNPLLQLTPMKPRAADQAREAALSDQRIASDAEPGGGDRGPHRDAPSRVGCGGKQAEDLSEPANAGRASSAGPRRTLH